MNIKNMIKKAQKNGDWDFANSVLYKLCSENIEHKNNQVILAKIWLIGRSYAAAIERRKNNKDDINDDFYCNHVAPKMRNSKLDAKINKCKKTDSIEIILSTHKYLTDIFYDLTELNKRSLASKYLHFHIPDKFFIYDSRVVGSIGLLSKELKLGNFTLKASEDFDEAYSLFYWKCKRAVEEIHKKYGIKLSCRQLDNLLIQIANDKLR